MSTSSSSPPLTPAQPRTPPPASPTVRITLPTPTSFSQRKAAQAMRRSISAQSDGSDGNGNDNGDKDGNALIFAPVAHGKASSDDGADNPEGVGAWKRGHGRSVSFNLPFGSPVTPITLGGTSSTDEASPTSDGLYKIPQRKSVDGAISAGLSTSSASPTFPGSGFGSGAGTGTSIPRRAPPRPLNLSRTTLGGISGSKTSVPLSNPSKSPLGSAGKSRWSTTAAARGLTLNPAALAKRQSTSVSGSIWSAHTALPSLGEASGWISPALASARSVMAGTRTRGLTVAIIKDEGEKEILIETLPTPGVPSASFAKMQSKDTGSKDDGTKAIHSPKTPKTAQSTISDKPREVILCRYYHTPGLTCTSRPCRFVHSLETLHLEGSVGDYDMRSPRTANINLASAKVDSTKNRSNQPTGSDPTQGTFAAHQYESRVKTLTIKDVDEKGIEPGERVVVAAENGHEVTGVVFLMSGGGKGAGGKSKTKYKTEMCRDYEAGHCSYGEYCSFLHEQPTSPVPPKSAQPDLDSPKTHTKASTEDKALRRKSFDPSAIKLDFPKSNAWERPLHLGGKGDSKDVKLSAFAPPFLDKPVEVNAQGELVPARVPRPTEGAVSTGVRVVVSEADGHQAKPAAPVKESNAWAKGPPPALNVTRPASDVTHTLTVPVSAASWLGTDSDPATPWDPALRAQRIADAGDASRDNRNPEYPPTAMFPAVPEHNEYAQGYDYEIDYAPYVTAHAMSRSSSHSSAQPILVATQPEGEYGYLHHHMPMPLGYPYNAPSYPWGMPMSPVTLTTEQGKAKEEAKPKIKGGLGVMWTPSGWAVQDAAMKMALFTAEVESMGGESDIKARNYWRTKTCRFFEEGKCPHGDECTYIHGPSQIKRSTRPTRKSDNKPNVQLRSQPCKFFNSAQGCLNGEKCAFLHELVVPDSVQLVDKHRPWRTRPCRHFQVGRCHLGNACHFAHVYEQPHNGFTGGAQDGYAGELEEVQDLTEERLERAMREMKAMNVKRGRRKSGDAEVEEDEESDDDVEIVTKDTSMSRAVSRTSGDTVV